MYFDRFDICAAYNLYSILWGWDAYTHGIQCRLTRLSYRPSHSEEYLEGLSENAREIYNRLVWKRHGIEGTEP